MYLVYIVDYFQTRTFFFLYTFCDLVSLSRLNFFNQVKSSFLFLGN